MALSRLVRSERLVLRQVLKAFAAMFSLASSCSAVSSGWVAKVSPVAGLTLLNIPFLACCMGRPEWPRAGIGVIDVSLAAECQLQDTESIDTSEPHNREKHMPKAMKASDLLVAALENEGVTHIF